MKKILGALFCALPLFYACKSLPSDLATYSPVAIMTVYGNPSVPLYDEKTDSETVDDGVLSGAVNRLINKKNPEVETAQERIDFASALLSERMRDFGLEVIDPTVLKEGSAYKHAGKTFIDYLGNTVPAAGYDAITSSSSTSLLIDGWKLTSIPFVSGFIEMSGTTRKWLIRCLSFSHG